MDAVTRIAAGTLRRQLDEAFAGPAWHGPSLRASLRGVSDTVADWRPGPDRHSIRDLALHAAYVKHRVAGRLEPMRRARFPRRIVDGYWPVRDADADWAADRALLDATHRRLVEAVVGASTARLATSRAGSSHTLAEEVLGAAMHDVYHAGQVRLLRRLAERE